MIDKIIVFSYLLIILIIGIYYRSTSGSFKSFAKVKDGNNSNKFLLVATIFAAAIGGGTTFGISEKAYFGSISYSYALLLTIPIDLLIAKYLLPRLSKHHGAQSVGDILVIYYGNAGRLIGGLAAILVSIGLVAAQINVSGIIFQYILNVNHVKGIILSYGIIIIYTTIGGLRSVMFTNLLQFIATMIAIPLITILGLYNIGLSNFTVPLDKYSFDYNLKQIIPISLGFMVMNLYPSFIQRALITQDYAKTRRAIYLKSLIYAIFLGFITLNGLIAFNLYPDLSSGSPLVYLIDTIMPTGIKGIVVIGMLATVMSTADSDLNVTSITIVKDILMPLTKELGQQKLLLVARIVNITVGSVAILIALKFSNVVDLVVFIASFWSPIILVPLVFALFDIVISKNQFIFSCLIGSASSFVWHYFHLNYWQIPAVFIGTSTSFIYFCASLVINYYRYKRLLTYNNE